MRNRAARNEKLAEIRIPTEPDIDSAGRSRNQSSSIDSSADRDILNGRSISPLEHISITPATTPDRIPSVSPTPPRRPNTAEVQSQRKRRNPCYFDGYNPMKATLKKKLRRRKLSKELDQLVDELDIDEGPPPSKLALTRTRYSEKKKIEQKKQEAIKAQEKEDALKQIFAITEF